MQSLSSGEDGHQVKCALMTDNKLFNRFTNITVCESLSLSLSLSFSLSLSPSLT